MPAPPHAAHQRLQRQAGDEGGDGGVARRLHFCQRRLAQGQAGARHGVAQRLQRLCGGARGRPHARAHLLQPPFHQRLLLGQPGQAVQGLLVGGIGRRHARLGVRPGLARLLLRAADVGAGAPQLLKPLLQVCQQAAVVHPGRHVGQALRLLDGTLHSSAHVVRCGRSRLQGSRDGEGG